MGTDSVSFHRKHLSSVLTGSFRTKFISKISSCLQDLESKFLMKLKKCTPVLKRRIQLQKSNMPFCNSMPRTLDSTSLKLVKKGKKSRATVKSCHPFPKTMSDTSYTISTSLPNRTLRAAKLCVYPGIHKVHLLGKG